MIKRRKEKLFHRLNLTKNSPDPKVLKNPKKTNLNQEKNECSRRKMISRKRIKRKVFLSLRSKVIKNKKKFRKNDLRENRTKRKLKKKVRKRFKRNIQRSLNSSRMISRLPKVRKDSLRVFKRLLKSQSPK